MTDNICINTFLLNFYNKRLFWLIVIGVSGWSMGIIFILMMARFHTDSTSIGVTTTYVHWTNTFPSVSICLVKNRITSDFTNVLRRRIPENQTLGNTYVKNIFDFLFVSSENSNIKEAYCRDYNATCGVDIMDLRRELLPRSCKTIIKEIYYANVLLPDCETIFKFHVLDMGNCFLSNNLMDYANNDLLPLKYSSLDKHRKLQIVLQSELIFKYQLYVHSPEDVPYFNAVSYLISTRPTLYSFNIEEVHNNDDVLEESINQRMCKFPEESTSSIFVYSFSTCMSQIRNQLEMKTCNCTLFNPSATTQPYCDVKGIKCLQEAYISEKVKDYVGTNLVCLPSCVEQQISYVGSIENAVESKDYIVGVEIASAPYARFHRLVTQTKLDLIVAIGGVLGLFIGASLLNILEVTSMFIYKIKHLLIN